MTRRSYDGPALDGTVQHFAERPYGDDDGETVDATPERPNGEATVESVPVPESGHDRPDGEGQTTWADWGWSR